MARLNKRVQGPGLPWGLKIKARDSFAELEEPNGHVLKARGSGHVARMRVALSAEGGSWPTAGEETKSSALGR